MKYHTVQTARKKVDSIPARPSRVAQIKIEKILNGNNDDFVHVAVLLKSKKRNLWKGGLYYKTYIKFLRKLIKFLIFKKKLAFRMNWIQV